jgi:5-dehydro-2-deoxygluconokinase
MTARNIDVMCFGRSSIDLYSNDIGTPFEEITNFAAFVGGCPTNIAVGTRRLGLVSALLTAVGEDPVGNFILKFLQNEKVETSFIARKEDARTSAVILGIEPPDKFPLVFYRENCADINLTIDDVANVPIEHAQVLLMTGTALSRDPSRSAAIYLMEKARRHGTKVFLDLDFRADQWQKSPAQDVRAFGVTIRSILHFVDLAFGTEEELRAATLTDAAQISIEHSQVSAPRITGDTNAAIDELLEAGVSTVVVKRGPLGSTVHLQNGSVETAQPFNVDVCNVLGAGDAFASGFIYGFIKGWDWKRCARMGNATGAIVVTKQGCANFMPTEKEAIDFVEQNGGFVQEEISCRL